jgi:hypothetical protein
VFRQDSADKLRVGNGARIITVYAQRCDSSGCRQAKDLGFHLAGIVKNGVWLGSGHERAVASVAAVGKALGDVADPLLTRQSFHQSARLPQERHAEMECCPGHPAGNFGLPLRLVVERTMRLEKPNLHANLGCQCLQARHLFTDELVYCVRSYILIAPPKSLSVRVTWMGADGRALPAGGKQRLANRFGIAGMGTAADARGRHKLEQRQVIAAAFAQIGVQVD